MSGYNFGLIENEKIIARAVNDSLLFAIEEVNDDKELKNFKTNNRIPGLFWDAFNTSLPIKLAPLGISAKKCTVGISWGICLFFCPISKVVFLCTKDYKIKDLVASNLSDNAQYFRALQSKNFAIVPVQSEQLSFFPMDDIVIDDGFEGNALLRELLGGIQNLDIDNMDNVRFSIISFQTNFDIITSLKYWVLDASFKVSIECDWLDLIKPAIPLQTTTADSDNSSKPLVSLKMPRTTPATRSLVNPKRDDLVDDGRSKK